MYAHTVLLLTCGFRQSLEIAWHVPVDHNLSASWHNPKEIQLWQKQFFVAIPAPWDAQHLCDVSENLSVYFRAKKQGLSEVSRLCWWCDSHSKTLEICPERQAEHLPAARGFWKKNPFSGAILASMGRLPQWCLWACLSEYPAKRKPAYLISKGSVSIKLEKQDLWPACFLTQGVA